MPVPGPSRRPESPKLVEEIEAFIEQISEDDGKKELFKQIAVGGFSGWVTGFVCQKVGKIAATAVGGGIILLQIAHHKGYIKVNWNRVNKDFEQVTKKIQKETFGKKKTDWTDKLERKAMALANRQKSWFRSVLYTEEDRLNELQIFVTSFTAGIALGLITGR